MLARPELLRIRCDECERYMVTINDKTAEFSLDQRGNRRKRAAGIPTPCRSCPKCPERGPYTPTEGRRSEFSPRNWSTLDLYYQQQASGGDVEDSLLRHNFGLIHDMLTNHDRSVQRALLATMGARA